MYYGMVKAGRAGPKRYFFAQTSFLDTIYRKKK
jgi:hypothetical protein